MPVFLLVEVRRFPVVSETTRISQAAARLCFLVLSQGPTDLGCFVSITDNVDVPPYLV